MSFTCSLQKRKQISVYFILVLVTALANSAAAILSILTIFVKFSVVVSMGEVAMLSAAVLICFAALETLYIYIVKWNASREISRLEITVRR